MLKIFSTGLLAALVATGVCNSGDNPKPSVNHLSAKEKAEGWELLFDGNSLKGWHSYGKDHAGNAWKVEDGAFMLDKSQGKKLEGGDLTSDKEYSNFDLKMEWKISPKGNSGIIFLVHEDTTLYKDTYETGPEMQVLDNDGHPDGKYVKHRAGDLYDLISASKEMAKPVGEWNQAEIKMKDGKLDFYLNGENVVSTTMWDDNWKQLVANSKFKAWPAFGTFQKGKICLQDHGNTVWYRNIKIKKL